MNLQVSTAAAESPDLFRGPEALRISKGGFWTPGAQEMVDIVRVLEGRVWLTSEAREEDHVLEAGDEIMASELRSILIEGLENSLVAIISDRMKI